MPRKTSAVTSVHPVLAASIVVVVALGGAAFLVPRVGADGAAATVSRERPEAYERVQEDFKHIHALIETELRSGRRLPADAQAVYDLWAQAGSSDRSLIDPFSGQRYDYDHRDDRTYRVWSAGPDGKRGSDDDIVFDSRSADDQENW
jgi:hypothetical protein